MKKNLLENLKKYLHPLINQSSHLFWIRNANYSKQLYVSPAYEKIWGKSCDSLYENNSITEWLNCIIEEDRKKIEKEIQKIDLTLFQTQTFIQHYRIQQPDSTIRWIEDESFAIFDENNTHIGFAGIATDITEIKQREIALIRAHDHAKKLSEQKSEFIANMSHDIKTPLTGMIGLMDFLIERLEYSHSTEELGMAKNISSAAKTLMNLVKNCIDMTRSEDGIIILKEEVFNIKDLFEELRTLFQPSADNKQLAILFNYPQDEKVHWLFGNRISFYRILVNLIGNAIKFTEKGYVMMDVSFKKEANALSKHTTLQIIVQDTGIGIPSNKIDSIFERYSRLPEHDNIYEGSGIGLHVVKKFVIEMGGQVHVTSELQKGTSFSLILPFTICSQQEIEKNQSIKDRINKKNADILQVKEPRGTYQVRQKTFEHIRILLIEDNEIAKQVAQTILERLGCVVDTAVSCEQALSLVDSHVYNLILTDMGLPGCSGIEIAQRIREAESSQRVTNRKPIVILTANDEDCILNHLLNDNTVDAIVSKPLSIDKAIDLITRYALNALNKSTKIDIDTKEDEMKTENRIEKIVIGKDADPELLDHLIRLLPEFRSDLSDAYNRYDLEKLYDILHKLHGGLCYTHTPDLRQAVKKVAEALQKRQLQEFNFLYHEMLSAADLLEKKYKDLNLNNLNNKLKKVEQPL